MEREILRVRAATRADSGPLAAFWLELVEHHRQLAPGVGIGRPGRAALLRELERAIASADARVVVGERGGRAVGFALAEVEPRPPGGERRGRIDEIFVAVGERGRGAGRALVEALDPFFRDHGVSRVSVRTEATNAPALEFWRGRGFAPRAHVLERELDPALGTPGRTR